MNEHDYKRIEEAVYRGTHPVQVGFSEAMAALFLFAWSFISSRWIIFGFMVSLVVAMIINSNDLPGSINALPSNIFWFFIGTWLAHRIWNAFRP